MRHIRGGLFHGNFDRGAFVFLVFLALGGRAAGAGVGATGQDP
jgi:hypothetical protein